MPATKRQKLKVREAGKCIQGKSDQLDNVKLYPNENMENMIEDTVVELSQSDLRHKRTQVVRGDRFSGSTLVLNMMIRWR